MADNVAAFECKIPANTPFPNTVTVNIPIGTNNVDRIRWRVPPGPRGNLSWFLAMGGVQVMPSTLGTAIVADNEYDDWYVPGLPNTGAWQLIGSNSGTFDHTVYLEFFYSSVAGTVSTGGDFLTGFPVTDADIPGMWLT